MCPLSKKYYDDCSNVLASLIVRAVFPRFAHPSAALSKLGTGPSSVALRAAVSSVAGLPARSNLTRTQSSNPSTPAGDITKAVLAHTASNSNGNLAKAGNREELRCVVAVFRHGDRTPKQKLKMVSRHPLFCGMLT